VCGCADNESSLFVRAVIAVEPPECVAEADPSTMVLGGGSMDVALTSTYQAALLVGNQLVRRGSRDQLRTETSRIALRGAEIALETSGGSAVADAFTINGTGFVDPGSGDTPGYGVMIVTLIPPQASPTPGTVVVARVKVFGDTLGGTEITSNELAFPISICEGCLVSFPPESAVPNTEPYLCQSVADGSSSSSSESELPCLVGQDAPVDCKLCVNSHPDVCTTPGG
jgi:hypothetical protein